jgi:hypothetical protein
MNAFNPFESYSKPHPGTVENALAVTPNDDADLPVVPTIIWLGTPGDVRVTGLNGEVVTLKNPTNLPVLFIRASRIHATGTTASDIVIMW